MSNPFILDRADDYRVLHHKNRPDGLSERFICPLWTGDHTVHAAPHPSSRTYRAPLVKGGTARIITHPTAAVLGASGGGCVM